LRNLHMPAAACALALALAACGGGGDTAETADTTPTEVVAEPTPTPTATEAVEIKPTPEIPATPTDASPSPTATATEVDAAAAEPSPAATVAGTTTGSTGELQSYTTDEGESMEYTVDSIVDPATDTVAANNYEVPEGQRYIFVNATFTWVAGDYENAFIYPNININLIDDRGNAFPHVIAIIEQCPSFEDEGLQPGDTITGCLVYEVSENTPIEAVEWSPILSDDPLRWDL
jgi:hypothetical protein